MNYLKDRLTEEQIKNIMLDYSEVDPNSPESVRKYGERCMIIGILYHGYKLHIKLLKEKEERKDDKERKKLI